MTESTEGICSGHCWLLSISITLSPAEASELSLQEGLTFSAMDFAMKDYTYKQSQEEFTFHLTLFHHWLFLTSLGTFLFHALSTYKNARGNLGCPSPFLLFIFVVVLFCLFFSSRPTDLKRKQIYCAQEMTLRPIYLAISMSFEEGIPT